jgi:DNA-binding beta-propeller fold protein YncE
LFTNLVNFLYKPRGLALDSSRNHLYVVDSYNNRIVIYDTQTGSVTNWGGPASGSGLGQFYQPMAVAVDPSNNVFVADTHNNRIQRWNATSSNWTEWTGINNPWDIALDWQTNLYVAEYYSNRVLKVTPSGARSTFASNGFADGLVRSPGGVTVDAYNNIVISDFPASQGRIQRFGTNGVLINRLGSYLGTEGSLAKPQNLQYAGCKGVLFVSDVGTNTSNTLLQRNNDSTWQTIISSGVVQSVGGLAWDPSVGYLYVSDMESNRVLRISLSQFADIPPSTALTPATNGMVIAWGGVANWFYTVQYTDSLIDPWTNLTGCVDIKAAYSFRFMSCIDTNNLGIPSRNYRMLYHE